MNIHRFQLQQSLIQKIQKLKQSHEQQKRNLIGIPMASTLEHCDLCGDDFPLRELELSGHQFLCHKCKSER